MPAAIRASTVRTLSDIFESLSCPQCFKVKLFQRRDALPTCIPSILSSSAHTTSDSMAGSSLQSALTSRVSLSPPRWSWCDSIPSTMVDEVLDDALRPGLGLSLSPPLSICHFTLGHRR